MYESDDKMVSHPSHYQSNFGIEAIDVIEAFTEDLQGIEAVDTANAIKYLLRWKHKNGIQDLEKAKWYIDHLVNHLVKEQITEHTKKVSSGRFPWGIDETFAEYDNLDNPVPQRDEKLDSNIFNNYVNLDGGNN